MNTREKIIVVLAAIAVLVGVGFVLLDNRSASTPAATVHDPALDQAQELRDRIQAEVSGLGLAPEQAGLLEHIAGPWARDPFLVPLERLDVARPADVPNDFDWFVYSGYIEVGPIQAVIINDRERFLGDELEVAGYRVLGISPDQVVIGRPDGESTLRVVHQGLGEP